MAKKLYELQPNDEVAESGDLSNLTPASIDLTSWQDLTIQDGEESIADKIAEDDAHIKSDGVASAFTEKTYAAGDFCCYDGKAYVCKLGYTSTAASPDPGNDSTHWQLANLPTLFSSDNTSNNADNVRVSATNSTSIKSYTDTIAKYPINTTATVQDRAINVTSAASVTVPDTFTDLIFRATVASSLAVTVPSAITSKYGDAFPSAAGEYLVCITKLSATEAYVRTIKLEAQS